MNILILGLGSIGQIHLRNLSTLNRKFNFFAIRKKFTTPSLNNQNLVTNQDIKKRYNLLLSFPFSRCCSLGFLSVIVVDQAPPNQVPKIEIKI